MREAHVNYFKLIRSGIDIAPLLEEIASQEQAWHFETSRQDTIKVQRDTILRGDV
jgi:hypothetical protein